MANPSLLTAPPPAASPPAAPEPASPTRWRLAALLVGGALLSKVLGLVRELVMARAVGASALADSFRGAGTLMLLPLVMLQNECVPAVLIPTYREWQQDGQAPRRFAALTAALTLIAAALSAGLQATAPVFIELALGGFSDGAKALTLRFLRIMAFAMPALVLVSCLAAAEIAQGRARLTSLRAVCTNLAVIAGIVILIFTGQADALAWVYMVTLNGLAVFALWSLLGNGSIDVTELDLAAILAGGQEFFRRLRPMILQPVAEQAQAWIERLLASGQAVGTLASLDYARSLSDSASLLVSQPIGLAVLSAGPTTDTRLQMERLARPLLAVAVPASIFLTVFAPEIVDLVFRRGAFDDAAVAVTSQLLRGIATGLWATMLGWVLLRLLNAAGRNRRATMIMTAAYSANVVANLVLVYVLGGIGLGLGEAVRSLVLLGGVAVALGCGRALLRLLLIAAPGAAVLLLAEWAIRAHTQAMPLRLLLGGSACAVAMGVSVLLLVPGLVASTRARSMSLKWRKV